MQVGEEEGGIGSGALPDQYLCKDAARETVQLCQDKAVRRV